MEKTFKLPKEFAEKWLEALRSGKYKQTEGTLVRIIEEFNDKDPKCKYCCLGVAGKICNISSLDMGNVPMLASLGYIEKDVPNELLDEDLLSFSNILAALNDGLTNVEKWLKNAYEKYPDLIFRKLPLADKHFTFKQIADFIEDNCEFYEKENGK